MRVIRPVSPGSITIVLCGLALVITLTTVYVVRHIHVSPPRSLNASFQSVEISVRDVNGWSLTQQATSHSQEKIAALVAVLRQARRTEDCKCGDIGTLLQQPGAEPVRLGLVPGHERVL
ncbi:MAG: hypothetical protein GX785_00875 [Armatimonadetes bacterium]|nr:hypothetical protein [Armatimonadota bacterium]